MNLDLTNKELEEQFNINSKNLTIFNAKYRKEYRVLRSIHHTEAGVSGYFTIGEVYINNITNEVCWFKTIQYSDEYSEYSHEQAKTVDIREWASAESNDRELEYGEYKEKMTKIVEALQKEPVYVMDFVEKGKYHELAIEWHKDKNNCLYYPLNEESVLNEIPKEIY